MSVDPRLARGHLTLRAATTLKMAMTVHRNAPTTLRFDTALGTCGVRWSEFGIAQVLLPGSRGLGRGGAPGPHPAGEGSAPDLALQAAAGIVALLGGEPRHLRELALDERALDAFRREVYAATREIGPGRTATYGEIARTIGEPGRAREVGAALARNPFPLVVPCHRVLAADGTLHGFSAPGGIATKRRLLELERAPGFAQPALFA